MVPSTPLLPEEPSLLKASKESLESLRIEFQSAVLEYKKERENYLRFANHLQTAIFNSLIDETTPAIQDKVKTLSPNMDFTLDGLRKANEKCSNIEDRIGNLIYWISRCEDQDSHQHYINNDDHFPNFLSSSQPVDHGMSEGQTDIRSSIVQELYDRIGDYRNYLDEIQGFEYGLHCELDERDVLRASGVTNLIPDEQFFNERKEQQAQLQRDLEAAEADIARLRKQCIRENIPFEHAAFPLARSHSSIESLALFSGDERNHPRPQSTSPTTSIITNFFETNRRVNEWVAGSQEALKVTSPSSPDQPEEQGEIDTISESSWVAPKRPHTARPSPATISNVQEALPLMPIFSGPPAGSPEIQTMLRTSISDSLFQKSNKQVRRLPSF